MNRAPDSRLAEVCDALAIEIEESADVDFPVPDLHDVFARARALDAGSIVAGLSPDVDPALLHNDAGEIDSLDRPGLDIAVFRDALRSELAATDDAKASAEPPESQRSTTWTRVAAVGLLAAAAVATLWLVPWRPLLGEEEAPGGIRGVEAHMQGDDRRDEDSVAPHKQRLPPKSVPEPESLPEPEPEPVPKPEPEPKPKPTPRRSADKFEQQARAHWEAGELDRAAEAFRKVIARSGKSNAAELAFGDLFAIARQQGGRRALAKVWREYLQRFPEGRYADDARGGLCRSADADAMEACWNRYLADFPAGAHAEHARTAIAKDPSP